MIKRRKQTIIVTNNYEGSKQLKRNFAISNLISSEKGKIFVIMKQRRSGGLRNVRTVRSHRPPLKKNHCVNYEKFFSIST